MKLCSALCAVALAGSLASAGNKVLSLDSGGYVEIPDNPSQRPSDKLTIEFWMNISSASGDNARPVSKRPGSAGSYSANIQNGASTTEAEFFNCANTENVSIAAAEWIHLAYVYDSSGVTRIYRNGMLALEGATPPCPLSQTADPLRFGLTPGFQITQFIGKLDNIRLWNEARTGSQIMAMAAHQLTTAEAAALPTLIGSWTFEDGDASDSTGKNSGNLIGQAWIDTDAGWTQFADCNNDGIPDAWQIASGQLADSDSNGIPDVCEATCGTLEWQELSLASAPSPRWSAQSCFSPINHQLLVFGGWCCGLGDMWGWNGTAWTELAPATMPPGRLRGAMVWDEYRNRAVMFGGIAGGSYALLDDTWEFDGSTWQQIQIPGPSSRTDHCMAYDPVRKRVVLFGGWNSENQLLNETWEYDGTQWVLVATTGPAPQLGGAFAYDASSSALILAGGANSQNIRSVWSWNGQAWSALPDAPATPGASIHAAWSDGHIGRAVFMLPIGSGDFGTSRPAMIENGAWTWAGPELSTWAFGPAVGYDPVRHAAILFGGALAPAGPASNRTLELRLVDSSNALVVTQQPTDQALLPNQPATFTIQTAGVPLSHQWRKNGVAVSDSARIDGSATATLTIAGIQHGDEGEYDCVIANACGSTTSDPAALSCKPIITTQPPTHAPLKRTLQLSIGVPESAPYTYRWQRNGVNLSNTPGTFSGATTKTLRILAPDFSLGGTFTCQLTDACGNTLSAATKVCMADFNADEYVDDTDFVDFARAYDTLLCIDPTMAAGCPADFNNDTVVDDADFVLFVIAYEELLCP